MKLNLTSKNVSNVLKALLTYAEMEKIPLTVNYTLDDVQKVKKITDFEHYSKVIGKVIHEIAHKLLFSGNVITNMGNEDKHAQAEGVSYIVLKNLGLPHKHTITYFKKRDIDPEKLVAKENKITKQADTILKFIIKYAVEGQDTIYNDLKESTKFNKLISFYLQKN